MTVFSRRNFNTLGVGAVFTLASCQKSTGAILDSKAMGGYYFPPEDNLHERTFMQWPTSTATYGQRDLAEVQAEIALIANNISEFEPVVMLAQKSISMTIERKFSSKVQFWDIDCDDLWCRDSGPTFVINQAGKLAISHIKFNGWGQKQDYRKDSQIVPQIARMMDLELIESDLFGEQGGLESDGHGTLLAHSSSWAEPKRNNLSEEIIGNKLMAALGARKIIWAAGLRGEDITDYHIDSLARFVSKGHILFQMPQKESETDIWYDAAIQTLETIRGATDVEGRPFKISTIETPKNIRATAADFVSSYVNYYVCNGAVICAEFGDQSKDQAAQDTLKQLYPNREIIALNIDAIGSSGGGIHCATQQQPKVN